MFEFHWFFLPTLTFFVFFRIVVWQVILNRGLTISPSFLSDPSLLIPSCVVALQLLPLVSSLEPGLILEIQGSCSVDNGWYRVTCLNICEIYFFLTSLPGSFMVRPGSCWQQLFLASFQELGVSLYYRFQVLSLVTISCLNGPFWVFIILTCLCQFLHLEHSGISSLVWYSALSLAKIFYFHFIISITLPLTLAPCQCFQLSSLLCFQKHKSLSLLIWTSPKSLSNSDCWFDLY